MKSSKLRPIILSLLLGTAFIACKKGNVLPYHVNQGIISANFGYYECATCGGYFIRFIPDTTKIYRTFQDLSNFGINSSSKFPVKATIGWKPDTASNLANFITVTSLKINN